MKNINDELIASVVDQIVYNFEPKKVILFSSKKDLIGKTISFKLCIIMDCEDKNSIERDIYINIDSDIPYDIVVYTSNEFNKRVKDESSFATKINKTGIIVYE